MSSAYRDPYAGSRMGDYTAVNSRTDLNSDKSGFYPPGAASNSAPYRSGPVSAAHKPWYKQKWFIIGAPILLVVAIAGGVAGGVLANKSKSSTSSSSNSVNGIGNADAGAAPVSGIQVNAAQPSLAAYSTDVFSNPLYATATTVAPAGPTVSSTSISGLCSKDSPQYQTVGGIQVRTDHPRLFASSSKWACLPAQIKQSAYLASWHNTILANASRYAAMAPTNYSIDGGYSGSGVLDVAREVQLRMKHWAYAWRMTNNTSWRDRAWQELQVASGNTSQFFGRAGNNWNTDHFLDVGEFTLAFAYAYDWMYDAWTPAQRSQIRSSIVNLGLRYGVLSYTDSTAQGNYGWWQTTNGNWNCVCNGGLTLGALAIATEDVTGTAGQILSRTIPNAQGNCMQATQSDGTWSETSDYWYFGTTGQSQMIAGLITATGSDQGLLTANANLVKTGLFHMYGMGFVEKFNYGDCGPNKYTATANGLMLYADKLNTPLYALFQRDRIDAAEPLSMMFYNPDTAGSFWYNLPLDHYFDSGSHSFAVMRGSWTNPQQIYSAIKSGNTTNMQNHNGLDTGDFVFEALGQRWAGQLCQDNYLSPGYFQGETQSDPRWLYYRCGTEGQNTLLMNGQNQIINQQPPTTYGTTGDLQTSLTYAANSSSASFFWTDMSATYGGTTVRRGMRLLNQRRQMLLQDEISSSSATFQWRMHTNATISYSNGNTQANLALGGQSLVVSILGTSSSGLAFQTVQPVHLSTDPPLPAGGVEEPNTGVSVLAINIPAGTTNLQVLFNPQWSGLSASSYVTPPSVALSSWSLTSHST